jgi:hypothetical protein
MDILLVDIGVYYWLLYQWLLMAIILVVVGGYYISGYWWLFVDFY